MLTESYLPRRFSRLTLIVLSVVFLIVCSSFSPAVAEDSKPAGKFEFDAWTFDRGNASVYANPDRYADYRDKYPNLVVGKGGQTPWFIEYDINFPAEADYTLHIQYGSPQSRATDVLLDGKKVGTFAGDMTGNPAPYMDRHPQHNRPRSEENFHGAEWAEACTFKATAGKHTLKFARDGLPPRMIRLRLEAPVAFPKDWNPGKREVNFSAVVPECRTIFLPADAVNVAAMKVALADVTASYGPRYPKGPQYLKQLEELEKKQESVADGTPEQQEKIESELKALRREAMLAHPELKFDKLLFVKRVNQGVSIYTGHNRDSNPGGNLCVLSPVAPDGKITELVPELKGGIFGRFDLSFDATKVIFCYTKEGGCYRIYEIDIDPATGQRVPGKSLRQITFACGKEAETVRCYGGTSYGQGYDDTDPCYMPNGKIMFASTRANRAVLCAPTTATTLHVMDGDGKNIRCISDGQVNELAPCLLDDGRVAYTRWEYVDKGFGNVQSLWAVRPDGGGTDHLYKNTLVRPGSMIHVRNIPGTRKIVTIGAGHHGGLAGPLIVFDGRRDRRNPTGMENITPEIDLPGLFPMTRKPCGVFREPHPFSEKLYLVSHSGSTSGDNVQFGIYTLDRWGNRAELYGDPELSCFQPTPLRPHSRPTEIAPSFEKDKYYATTRRVVDEKGKVVAVVDVQETKPATIFLQDVYRGLTGIKRGEVKYIRVMEAMTLSWNDAWRAGKQGDGGPGLQSSAVSFAADVATKKTHGIATVHEDGSAFFKAPSEKNIYFQALDENYMELQRMRTFINLMPGENRSCIGCHEVRRNAPGIKTAIPTALNLPIESLYPQPGDTGPRTIHYTKDIQPIFDKNCISCHSGDNPKGELDLTDELTEKFNRGYENIGKKYLVSFLEGGFGSANVPAEPPKTFGSHQSILVERIRKAPCKSNITRKDFIKIVTWIDANAPYYGTHEGKKNIKWKDDADFRPMPLATK